MPWILLYCGLAVAIGLAGYLAWRRLKTSFRGFTAQLEVALDSLGERAACLNDIGQASDWTRPPAPRDLLAGNKN